MAVLFCVTPRVFLPGARDAAQRRRGPRLQPLRLLPVTERRHPAGLLHHAADRRVREPHPAGPGLLTSHHHRPELSVCFCVSVFMCFLFYLFFSTVRFSRQTEADDSD